MTTECLITSFVKGFLLPSLFFLQKGPESQLYTSLAFYDTFLCKVVILQVCQCRNTWAFNLFCTTRQNLFYPCFLDLLPVWPFTTQHMPLWSLNFFNNFIWGRWRAGKPTIMSGCYSSEGGNMFNLEHLHQVVYNCLYLKLQGI